MIAHGAFRSNDLDFACVVKKYRNTIQTGTLALKPQMVLKEYAKGLSYMK